NQVIGLGHRSLALITAEHDQNDRARKRVEGLYLAMRENGLNPEDLQIVETTYSIENGAKGFDSLMAARRRPTAIICGNDVLAAGALTRASETGVSVPDEVSITGFDDIELATIVTPTLTTVHVPHKKMGKKAAGLLVALRNGDETNPSVELETDIKWRRSLGPAARRAE
ncbi:MAG: substrate-binding domain-containing protein, partial [Pseudomonadota bacterium]